MTDDLVTWLRAQLDVDEASEWPHRPSCQMLNSAGKGILGKGFSCNCDAAARWYREIEAKRRIIDLYARTQRGYIEQGSSDDFTGEQYLRDVLRLFALPYDARPGYREEWRPEPSANHPSTEE